MATVDRLLVAVVVAFACLLRLWDLPLVSITADEGLHGLFARFVSLFDFEKYSVVGLPSVGVRNSALFIYLLAIPNFVVRHPLSGAAFIALLQVAAIFLTYRYALHWFGRTTAVTASVLWTFSPWAVLYARNMWPPSALAPFVVILLVVGTRWYMEGDRRSLRWCVLLAFIIPQVHFSGFCAPVWIGLLVLGRVNGMTARDWGTILLWSLIGLLTWAPWIYWQHVENHWQDLAQIGNAAKGKSEFSFAALFTYFFDLLHTSGLNYWFRTPESELPLYFPVWLAPIRSLVGWGLIAVFFWGVVVAAKSAVGRILLLWTTLPLVMLSVLRPLIHPHYEFLAYPVPYLIIGIGMESLLRDRTSRWAGFLALLIVVATFGMTLDGWRRYIAEGRLDGGDRYQLSYRQRVTAVRSVIADSHGTHIDIAGPFSGQQPAYVLPFDHEIERISKGRWPRDRSRVYWMDELRGNDLSQKAMNDLANVWPYLRDVRIEKFWKVGPTRIFKLVGTPTAQPGR
jgi:hypothetical protein